MSERTDAVDESLLLERFLASLAAGDTQAALGHTTALAQGGKLEAAIELASRGVLAQDPEAACLRGAWQLALGRPDAAVEAADVAIARLLHDGTSVEEFIRLSLRRAPAEGLLRYERSAIAQVPRLHEPLALRWEALRRAGRKAEAAEMRRVCIQHFPERASVWSTAGNQALDEQDFDAADRYFERCLKLAADWPGGLAGKAIVLETRKDWLGALRFRARVVEVTDALQKSDPASLQRVIRYAAALARVGAWLDAGVLLRQTLALGAYDLLPAERPVFVRVFARELYAPAVIATLQVRGLPDNPELAPDVALAVREAEVLARLYEHIHPRSELPTAQRLNLLGMCAWLAGDVARAYGLFDEAEVELEGDMRTQHLLACCAAALGAEQLSSIAEFALAAARGVLDEQSLGEPISEDDQLYAVATLARLTQGTPPEAAGEGAIQFYTAARGATPDTCPLLAPLPEADVIAQLERLVAFRVAQAAAGLPAIATARASAAAIERLAESLPKRHSS